MIYLKRLGSAKTCDNSNYVASDPIPLKTLKDLKLGQRIVDLKL